MWTVTTKWRDIWTWSSYWKRRNHGWWVGQLECCRSSLHLRWKKVLPFPFSQEYETTRKEIESVKKEREEAKKNLSALRHSQAPMVRKIKEIDEQLQPTEDQVMSKVKKRKEKEKLLEVSTLIGSYFVPVLIFLTVIVHHSILLVGNDEYNVSMSAEQIFEIATAYHTDPFELVRRRLPLRTSLWSANRCRISWIENRKR